MEEINFHQDNMSDTIMEKNGKYSSTKWKNNIRLLYFFIKYCVDNGDLSLEYCPAGEMFAYSFTKPLQGATFWKFQDMIEGIPEITQDV